MMRRHRLAHPAQHRYRLGIVRFIHLDHLETTGQGRVFFEIFLVFAPRGGRNRTHFAACQCRFQQIGGVVLASCTAGTNQGVRFVDEHDDRRGAGFDFINHAFQAIFEFALYRRAGLQQAQVQRQQFHALQLWWHIVGGNAQRQAFYDCGFADAGFTGENRVVLPTAGEHVDHQANFRIAPQHRVEFAFARTLGQVDAVLIQIGGLAGAATAGCCTRHAGITTTHCGAGIAQGASITCLRGGFGKCVEVLGQGFQVYFFQRACADTHQTSQFGIRQ